MDENNWTYVLDDASLPEGGLAPVYPLGVKCRDGAGQRDRLRHIRQVRAHTFATRLAQSGIDLYMISRLLGHKDIKMTQHYAHHCPDSLRNGVEVLDRISTNLAQSNEKGLAV